MESDNITSSRIIDDEDTMFDAPQKKGKTTNKTKQSDDTKYDYVSETIKDAKMLEELEKNDSSEQIESRDIGHLQNANQEIDNDHIEIDISLKGEFSSACLEMEKDAKMDLSECVGDVSCFFFHFFIL